MMHTAKLETSKQKGETMSRISSNEYRNGALWAGFDYTKQAWVENGRYVSCSHPSSMDCGCYGKVHAGKLVTPEDKKDAKLEGGIGPLFESNCEECGKPIVIEYTRCEACERRIYGTVSGQPVNDAPRGWSSVDGGTKLDAYEEAEAQMIRREVKA